jgi:4-hydroxy-tetrahydrodipicolinate synthase
MGAGGVLGRAHSGFYDHLWRGEIDQARACGAIDRLVMTEWYTPELVGRFGSNPAILKSAFNIRGIAVGAVRAPLLPLSPDDEAKVRATFDRIAAMPGQLPAAGLRAGQAAPTQFHT